MTQDGADAVGRGIARQNHWQLFVKVCQDLVRDEEVLDTLKRCRLVGPSDPGDSLVEQLVEGFGYRRLVWKEGVVKIKESEKCLQLLFGGRGGGVTDGPKRCPSLGECRLCPL